MTDEVEGKAWVITKVWSPTGIQIDIKESGASGVEAVDRLYETITHGIEKYGWQIEQTGAPKAAKKENAAPAQKTDSVDTSVNTLEVVRVEVTPKPDDKVEIKFYGPNHKFPDLYYQGEVKKAIAALSTTGYEWDEGMLSKAAEFDLNFYADWRHSEKLNSNGKPYKNIIGFRAVDATA